MGRKSRMNPAHHTKLCKLLVDYTNQIIWMRSEVLPGRRRVTSQDLEKLGNGHTLSDACLVVNTRVICASLHNCSSTATEIPCSAPPQALSNPDINMVVDTIYYDALQVPPTASELDIKKAYRRLAIQLHPGKLVPAIWKHS